MPPKTSSSFKWPLRRFELKADERSVRFCVGRLGNALTCTLKEQGLNITSLTSMRDNEAGEPSRECLPP